MDPTAPSSWNAITNGRVPWNGYRFTDVDTQSRFRRQSVPAGGHAHCRESHQVFPDAILLAGLDEPADLLSQEIGTRGVHVQTGDSTNRSFAGMRRHTNSGRFRGGRDLPQRAYAAHMRDIRLQNIDDAHVD